ncbi:MAG: response regulator [Lachnospiraceae bacterium]|nr:response regulator [Lachnospiraceae bacterium]
MERKSRRKDYFETSHLTILFCYSIFSVILIGESLLLGWEGWAIILVAVGMLLSWALHIRQVLSATQRTWVYASLMMATAFFYGTHVTSTYDLGLVMSVVVLIFVSTGIPGLITMCQGTYYLAMSYDIYQMYRMGETFDALIITRTALHFIVITLVGYIGRWIIRKWILIMNRSEEEKEALADTAERLNDFLANISHEIRTPINAVIGLTGVSIEKVKDEDVRADLGAVLEAGKRVGDQISDILDYSEIDMDSLAVNEENYMLSSLLNDLVAELDAFEDRGLELVIDVDPRVPSVMATDVTKLKKILKHLINNGLKYTKEGGVYVHIGSEKRSYGVNLMIEVRDTGIGMSSAEMERVFDRFYQSDSGRTRSTSGLGLGLSIVNGFTRSLNGFLVVDSEEGKGTTVRVSLPQKVVDSNFCMTLDNHDQLSLGAYLHFEKYPNPEVREYYNAMVRDLVIGMRVQMQRADNMDAFKKLAKGTHFTHVFVGKEEYEEDPVFMDRLAKETLVAVICDGGFVVPKGSNIRTIRKPFYCFPVISVLNTTVDTEIEEEGRLCAKNVRALVVDDEPMNHTVARGIFSRYGMIVTSVDSGPEAIDYIKTNETDIIFMDHMMPGMDGVEAMKRIRSELSREHRDVPIVALTANAVSTAKQMFLSEGFDGFVAKPIEIMELERVLKMVLPKSMITYEICEETPVDTVRSKPEPAGETTPEDPYAALKDVGIDADTGLHYSQNDAGFYKELLEQYVSDAPKKSEDAQTFFDRKDFKNYEVLVHAIKSTSKMIGATHISEEALKLEKAAEAQDEETITRMHADVMEEYHAVVSAVGEYLGIGAPASSGDDDEILEFGAQDEDEILEFGPEGGEEA